MDQTDDLNLFEDLRAHRPGAFRRLFEAYWPALLRMAHTWFGNRHDAEDAAIQAFEDIARGLPGFRGDSRLSTWVYSVAWHRMSTSVRRLRRQSRLLVDADLELLPDPGQCPEQEHDTRVAFRRALRLVSRLPRCERQAIKLCRLVGMDAVQAAAVLRVRPATVRQRLSRATRRLRQMREEEG